MVIDTLLDVFGRFEGLGKREAIRFLSPYRRRILSYREVWLRIGAFSHYLSEISVGPGDRILLWGENSPNWIIAFWGGLLRGAQIVPLDPNTSPELAVRILRKAECRLAIVSSDERGAELPIDSFPFERIDRLPLVPPVPGEPHQRDIAEILFTSGTTGDPKGIVHRHQTMAANLRPFASEFGRYRWVAAPFQPIRIMSLLPLSHMFGQAMGLFIPPLLGGSVVLLDSTNPSRVLPAVRSERVSVLATVPRILRQCEESLRRQFGEPLAETRFTGLAGFFERWWRHSQVHSSLGWKFWAVVSGGAALEASQERFWSRIGILALQGYGLTEAGPVISVNHPFKSRSGTVGKVLAGQQVRLADDGEILVSGDSVSFELLDGSTGYLSDNEGDWLRTGDIGAFDRDGNLHFRGRKKDVIVTSDGMNVYPEEVETVLLQIPGVRDAAVVAARIEAAEVVHAVLIPEGGGEADLPGVIAAANRRLEPHQRIRHWSVWPEAAFPRTPSTLKLRRSVIREWLGTSTRPEDSQPPLTVETLLSRLSGYRAQEITNDSQIDTELGLTSLDRVELLQGLENLQGAELSESEFTDLRTVGEIHDWLKRSVSERESDSPEPGRELRMPYWNLHLPFRLFRALLQRWLITPLYLRYIPTRVIGTDNLTAVLGQPLIIASNHQSHMDTLAILAALPPAIRLAPAVRLERFRAFFNPGAKGIRGAVRPGIEYLLACLFFNAFPLPQRSSGVRQALQFEGELLNRGFTLLVFPEGKRSPDGRIQDFKPGVILMSRELKAAILPVHLAGIREVLPVGTRWPRAHEVTVTIGTPFELVPDEDLDTARKRLEEVFRRLEHAQ